VQHRFSASCWVFRTAYRFADLIQQEGEEGMEPDDLLCSPQRAVLPQKKVKVEAQVEH
jgi:hypothetical protein